MYLRDGLSDTKDYGIGIDNHATDYASEYDLRLNVESTIDKGSVFFVKFG